jgi:hypothetical protein
VDVLNFTFVDCCLFQFGDSTVFRILCDCGCDNPINGHHYSTATIILSRPIIDKKLPTLAHVCKGIETS